MTRRIVVPRLPGSSGVPGKGDGATDMVDPPTITAIRMVYGVGPASGEPPDDASFKATYAMNVPVFSIGGLDPDGVYEFDAAGLLDTIRQRSLRRKWGLRLEIELSQAADTVSAADIHVDTPFADTDDAPTMRVVGRTGRGTTLPGGGRTVVLATSIVHEPKQAGVLSGIYSIQIRDTALDGPKPTVASLARGVNVDLTRFEFEG